MCERIERGLQARQYHIAVVVLNRASTFSYESTTTTHRYVEADLAMKEKALVRLEAPDTKMRRYRAPDALMRFLQTL
jgi:hypothetical protein